MLPPVPFKNIYEKHKDKITKIIIERKLLFSSCRYLERD